MIKKRQSSRPVHRPAVSRLLVAGALIPIGAALLASVMMSIHRIWSIGLPGCGAGGGCEWAVKSQWSNLFGMPTPFIGMGYFAALLILWSLTARHGIWRPMLNVVRIGALVSIGFSVLMIVLGHFCVWCVTTHIANLSLFALLEFGAARYRIRTSVPATEAIIASLVFLIIAVSMKLLDIRETRIADLLAQKAAAESIARIGEDEPAGLDSQSTPPIDTSDKVDHQQKRRRVFGGRYWTGAENAAVRIVIFHDYRCELCKEVEQQIGQLLAARNDVAVSIKQWPFDKECNSTILGENIHPGACIGARYAEAAGLIGGDSAFWRVHRWIMENNGDVTVERIQAYVGQLGLDWGRLQQAAQGGLVDSIIGADIQDGLKFGIKFTPMLFVNGYELQGWQSAGAIPAAVDRAALLARTSPKQDDQPEAAVEREFNQWLAQPMTRMVIRRDDHVLGRLSAPAAIIMYGDVSEPYNAAAFDLLKPLIADTSKVCFIFRVFPLQSECNDMVKRRINDRACEAARALEATGITGGAASYQNALRWFMKRRGNLPDVLIPELVKAASLETDQLTKSVNDPSIDAYIAANVESAKQLDVQASPTIFINGRKIANWRTPGLMQRIISHLTEK